VCLVMETKIGVVAEHFSKIGAFQVFVHLTSSTHMPHFDVKKEGKIRVRVRSAEEEITGEVCIDLGSGWEIVCSPLTYQVVQVRTK
jgi:hypothetical protein